MGVRIRKADPAERETLSEIARAAKRHWGYPEAWMALWEDELAFAPDCFDEWQVWCASVGGEVVGVASLSRDGNEAELENLWVLPDFIGRGVGKALFRHAATSARRQGCGRLRIVSDPNARAFYERMGARIDGDTPSRPEGRRLPCLTYDLAR